MYIRFVTDWLDEDTAKPIGVFAVAYKMLDDHTLEEYERVEISALLDWFKKELPVPKKFSRSRKPGRQDKGVCWFKTSASDCVHNVRYLALLLREHNVVVNELVTTKPGYLVYEDEHQIVAEPYSITPTLVSVR